MKQILFLLLFCLALVSNASATSDNDTFTVKNFSSLYSGTVTINYSTGGTSVNVPGIGNYGTSITASVVSIVINGVTVANGVTTVIGVGTNNIRVSWESPVVVIVETTIT